MKSRLIAAATLALLSATSTVAAEIKVISSTGMSTMFKQLIPAFERASGHKVAITYDTSNIILGRIKGGETADLIVLTGPVIDDLARQGKVAPGSRADLARSGIGVAVKSGAPKPDIGSVDAFRRTLLSAKSIAYTATGASGIYFAGVTEKLGIGAEVKAKAKTPAGGHVAELVARGEAEMAVQMISELRGVPGADYVGPLPGDLQMYTVFSAGIFAGAKEAEAAQALIRFLSTPDAAATYKAGGMEPG
jgi:molybdate transport system substrate-binding protein